MDIGELFIPLEYIAAGILVTAALAMLLTRRRDPGRNDADDAVLLEAAASRGWQLAIRRSGRRTTYHFTGTTDDVSWELDSVLLRESPEAMTPPRAYTRWRSAFVRLETGVVEGWPDLGRPLHQGVRLDAANPVDKLLPGVVSEALDLKKGRSAALLDVQAADGVEPELARRIRFLTTPGVDVRPFVGPASARAIIDYLDWSGTREGQLTPGAPLTLILFASDGLTILTHGTTADPEIVDRIVRLGASLATAYRSNIPAAEPLQD